MLTLVSGRFEVALTDDPTFTPGSADNNQPYDRTYHLGSGQFLSSRHAVRSREAGREITSCIVTAGGGATGIHKHSAIIREETCFIAVGPFVAALSLPALDLQWSAAVDEATCFGIYDCPDDKDLITHGELTIVRLTPEGRVVWRATGADIFTEGFVIENNAVRAVDFTRRVYLFDLETGRVAAE